MTGTGAAAEQARREARRIRARAAAIDRHFLAHVPLLGEVLAVNVCEPLPDHQPQPAEKRLIRLLEVMLDPLHRVDISLLKHIGRRHPPGKPVIEPQLHHPAQLVPMAGEQLRQCLLIATAYLREQVGNIRFAFNRHRMPHI